MSSWCSFHYFIQYGSFEHGLMCTRNFTLLVASQLSKQVWQACLWMLLFVHVHWVMIEPFPTRTMHQQHLHPSLLMLLYFVHCIPFAQGLISSGGVSWNDVGDYSPFLAEATFLVGAFSSNTADNRATTVSIDMLVSNAYTHPLVCCVMFVGINATLSCY